MNPTLRICALFATLFTAQAASAADIRPPYAPPSYAPPPVVVDTYQAPYCYAMFHTLPDAEGHAVLREGPEEVPVIRALRYDNGLPLWGRVRSVTTSPGARIELFQGRRYRRLLFDVGPGSMINLRHPRLNSYRLICPEPPPPPPVPHSFK